VTRWLILLWAAGVCPAETWRYSINWPTGLSLGESSLTIRRPASAPAQWEQVFQLDASVPGFAVSDRYRSLATESHCSLEFEKVIAHGAKRDSEKTVFEPGKRIARRETQGGGKSEIAAPECARDALAFLGFLRQELAQGRIPGMATVFFGAPYQVSLRFGGAQRLRLESQAVEADRIDGTVKGPVADIRFELFFSKDAGRKLVLARVPLPVGSFSMELIDE
jgi:hypothetical protein